MIVMIHCRTAVWHSILHIPDLRTQLRRQDRPCASQLSSGRLFSMINYVHVVLRFEVIRQNNERADKYNGKGENEKYFRGQMK